VGSLPPVFVVSIPLLFGFVSRIAFSFSGVRGHRVKTLVQEDVQSENVTVFTTRGPAISWTRSLGTVLNGSMGDDRLICNTNDPPDGTFWCRISPRKKARTTSARLGQLPTREEENFAEEATTDGSD
jgi:hypothetical protein